MGLFKRCQACKTRHNKVATKYVCAHKICEECYDAVVRSIGSSGGNDIALGFCLKCKLRKECWTAFRDSMRNRGKTTFSETDNEELRNSFEKFKGASQFSRQIPSDAKLKGPPTNEMPSIPPGPAPPPPDHIDE